MIEYPGHGYRGFFGWVQLVRSTDWLAHSFLAFTPGGDDAQKQVVPLLGFSWGFVIGDHGRVTLTPIRRLTADDWKSHLLYLRRCYPGWKFAPSPSL